MSLLKVKELVCSNPVVVFSQNNCSFCDHGKDFLTKLGVSFKLIELDKEDDGAEIQSALTKLTAQPTLPNVFIGGKHIGGSGVAMALHNQGKLLPLLTQAGAIVNSSA